MPHVRKAGRGMTIDGRRQCLGSHTDSNNIPCAILSTGLSSTRNILFWHTNNSSSQQRSVLLGGSHFGLRSAVPYGDNGPNQGPTRQRNADIRDSAHQESKSTTVERALHKIRSHERGFPSPSCKLAPSRNLSTSRTESHLTTTTIHGSCKLFVLGSSTTWAG